MYCHSVFLYMSHFRCEIPEKCFMCLTLRMYKNPTNDSAMPCFCYKCIYIIHVREICLLSCTLQCGTFYSDGLYVSGGLTGFIWDHTFGCQEMDYVIFSCFNLTIFPFYSQNSFKEVRCRLLKFVQGYLRNAKLKFSKEVFFTKTYIIGGRTVKLCEVISKVKMR